jgi:hypothetical protein
MDEQPTVIAIEWSAPSCWLLTRPEARDLARDREAAREAGVGVEDEERE